MVDEICKRYNGLSGYIARYLVGQKLLPGAVDFAPLAATRIITNVNSASFVVLQFFDYFNWQDQQFVASCEIQFICYV